MPSLIILCKTKMVQHVWSPCLLSLLLCLVFFCFFFTASTASARPLSPLPHYDGQASRKDLTCHPNVKVTTMLTTSFDTMKQNNPEGRPSSTSRMIDSDFMSKQATHKLEEIMIAKKTTVHNNKIATICNSAAKVSSKSISLAKQVANKNKGRERRLRKLLPRQRDLDSFVAYADYRGPIHHPPKNN